MKQHRLLRGLVVLALMGSGVGAVHAAGDATQGEWKAIPCMGCHGIPRYSNIYPTYHVPKVGGQHPEYLVEALKAYRSGKRPHKTMRAQAATLTDQDIEDIAAYFSTGPAK